MTQLLRRRVTSIGVEHGHHRIDYEQVLRRFGEDGFFVQEYTIHIAPPIYPMEDKSRAENIAYMKDKNYAVWKEIYETTYGEPLVYTCEEMQAPVIIAIHPDELEFVEDSFVKAVIEEAHKATVPVCVHLDHGSKFEQVLRAIQDGFTSVMIDGAHLSLEDNIAITTFNNKSNRMCRQAI